MVQEFPAAIEAKKYQELPGPGQPYSVALPGSATEGRSAVYRNFAFQDELLSNLDPSIRSMHDAFEASANRVPNKRCLGHRPYDRSTKTFGRYVWQDYQTIQRRRANLGSGLVALHKAVGVMEEKYGIGLWCQNCPDWQITDLAAMSQGLFTVSLYDTLGPEATEYIINHAQLVCVTTSLNHIATLLKLKPRMPSLKIIMSLDPLDNGDLPGHSVGDVLKVLAQDVGVQIHYIRDVEAMGEKSPRPYNPPEPEDTVTINYTSGTTGNPKGVILTQSNAIAATCSSMLIFKQNEDDIICSFLPLAHIYQRVSEHTALWAGATIGYFHGNVAELVEDLKLLRPTGFCAVPRLFNRFGSAIKDSTIEAPGFRGALSRHVVSTKMASLTNTASGKATNKHAFYDRIWSKKVISAVGLDRCTMMVSGSAPLDPSLHQFLRVVFANNFVQGYGLTETYAVSLVQLENDFTSGNCGAVCPTTEVCLRDVPDMEYLSSDKPFPRGELLIRSTSTFKAYFKNEEETKKAIDEDGWFHTGDICTVDELGRFKIIDRVKNVLKLAQGEYISPERIENVYLANCSWLASAYVHGDSHQSFLVAIFGVEPASFAAFASKVLGSTINAQDIAAVKEAGKSKKVQKAVVKELEKIGRKNKFNSYERVRNVRMFVEPFTVDNELLTPTLKLKRPQAARKFRDHLDEMYEEALKEEAASGRKAKL